MTRNRMGAFQLIDGELSDDRLVVGQEKSATRLSFFACTRALPIEVSRCEAPITREP
jgi:hypothetical protein